MDGRIARLACTATVIGRESRSVAHAEGVLRTELPAALPAALERALAGDPAVYVARSLRCDVHAVPGDTGEAMARSIAVQLARAVRDPDRDSTGLVRFGSVAEYLAAFLAAVAQGDAWHRWYFRPLLRLAHLEPPALFLALHAEGEDMARVLLMLHRSGKLGPVLSAAGEEAVGQVWPAGRPERSGQAEWLSLVRSAVDLAQVLGWVAVERLDPQAVAAGLAGGGADLDWTDPVGLAHALARAVWLVSAPAAGAGAVSAARLPGWLDWADADALVQDLSVPPRPAPRLVLSAVGEDALVQDLSVLPRPAPGPVLSAVGEDAMGQAWPAGRPGRSGQAEWLSLVRFAVDLAGVLGWEIAERLDLPAVAAGLAGGDGADLDWADPVGLAHALARAVRLVSVPVAGAGEVSAARLPGWLDWADADALVQDLSVPPRPALPSRSGTPPPARVARPPRTLAIEATLAGLLSGGVVVLDHRCPTMASVQLWAALTERMPELAEAAWARDVVSRFVDRRLADTGGSPHADDTAEARAGAGPPPVVSDVRCAGVYLLLRTLDAIRMPGLCRDAGVPPASVLPMLARRWAGPEGAADVAQALRPVVGDAVAPQGPLAADALRTLQAEVARIAAAQYPAPDTDTPGRSVPPADRAAVAHARSGEPAADLALDAIALTVLRHWARWLRGFGSASVPYLLSTFIRRPGRVAAADADMVRVSLSRQPHDVALDVSGCLDPFEFQWPWLPAGRTRRIEFVMGA